MAIKINFDLSGNPELSTFILAKKNGDKIGLLKAEQPVLRGCLNSANEITFDIHKTLNGTDCDIWNEITDFKLLWCKEWDSWFEITVELKDDDENDIYKSIIATSLCESELSQINLNNIEINTEDDIARDDYTKPTVFYNPDDTSISLLNRISEKIPHYTIGHIDTTLMSIQRSFSFDTTSVYDGLQQIAEEIGCIFIFDNGTRNNKPSRMINAYDLMTYCDKCKNRGEFTVKCSNCGCEDKSKFKLPYGVDTTVFVSKENFAKEISYSVNTDRVKNCFKLEAGDDLMTATIRNCNPNGSDYIWHISDNMRKDMSVELQNRITSYDKEYADFQNGGKFKLQSSNANDEYYVPKSLHNYYNSYYDKYKTYNENLKNISDVTIITNYAKLMTTYYNTIDMQLLIESGLMPVSDLAENADEVAESLYNNFISPVGIIGLNDNTSDTTIENAVKYMIEAVIEPYYAVTINTTSIKSDKSKWYGTVTITSLDDSDDSCESEDLTISLCEYTKCTASYIESKLQAALKTSDISDYGINQLFGYYTSDDGKNVGDFKLSLSTFKSKLTLYCLSCLNSFRDACQTVLDILIEQGMGNSSNEYYSLYSEYYKRLKAIENEIDEKESQLDNVNSLQTYLINIRNKIQSSLNFESYLGKDLWKEFSSYRREDKYSNSNYVSDGLNNAELIVLATEFIKVATEDLYKSGELQHTISASLKNLLLIDEFKPLLNSFELGNYIRVEIDGSIYRLRLIEYKIDFDNLEDIYIEFSDATKVINGISDLESLLNQSQNMATSYDNIQKQAQNGNKGYGRLTDWVEKGLDITNTNIVNNADNNKMTFDEHGILMREYDPVTETFSNKQVKITNRGLYVTDDSWATAKVGVGNFIYYNPVDGEYYESYGVIADTLVGNLILGEEIGIYTEKNDITINNSGLIISNKPYAEYSSSGETKITMNPNSDSPFRINYDNNTVMRVSNNGELYINRKLNVHNKFIVDNDGNIDMDGEITLGGNINMTGNIVWGEDTGVVYTLYSNASEDNPPTTPKKAYSAYTLTSDTSDSSWHKQFSPTYDKWIARYVNNVWTVEKITFLTHIDAGGIYTGTLNADNIHGGKIITSDWGQIDNSENGYIIMSRQIMQFKESSSGSSKMTLGFMTGESGYNEPIIAMGAGDGSAIPKDIGYINKTAGGFNLFYNATNGKVGYIAFKKDGTVRINGIEFPIQSSDTMANDFTTTVDYWTKKLQAIDLDNKLDSVGIGDGSGNSININPAAIGDCFSVVEQNGRTVVQLKSNVEIKWVNDNFNSVNDDIDTALDKAGDAISSANTVGNNLLKLANGTYTAGTFISGNEIASPIITGADFYDATKIGKLNLSNRNGTYADLIFTRQKDGQELFKAYDSGDGNTSLFLYGHSIGYGSSNTFYPVSNWNFNGATIINLKVKFG